MARKLWIFGAIAATLAACSQPVYRTRSEPLRTVASVDLARYAGRWFEIYRLPNGFEDADCASVTADYAPRPDGLLQVVNTCVKPGGDFDRSRGVARVVDPLSRSRLEVSFFRPFWGNYWIIELSDDYSWAMIAEPSGKYLWLLARTPAISGEVDAQVIARMTELGYPVGKLIKPANLLPVPGVSP
jgi:apolipoprotein D and lipocalin family protein